MKPVVVMENILPNTLVLTYPKTGSTSLHAAFVAHPEIGMPNAKETFFFSNFYHHGRDWYANRFTHAQNSSVRCDFVTTLMHEHNFIYKIHETVPHARFIVLLRDPVQRCVSHYLHELRRGLVEKSFEGELKREQLKIIENPANYSHFAFKSIGDQYKDNAEKLIDAFGKERIRFILLEQLVDNPDCLKTLYDFMGIAHRKYFPRINTSRMPKEDMASKSLRAVLVRVRQIPTNRLLKKMTPDIIKVSTRKYRQKIDLLLRNIEESKTNNPIEKQDFLSSSVIEDLEQHYRILLKGLDKIIGIDLKKYWCWYENESL